MIEVRRSPAPFALSVRDWARALRIHQWSKNLLIFIPIFLAHKFQDLDAIKLSCIGFLLLGMVASASYIINDLSDLAVDRLHPTKRTRPLTAGRISVKVAIAVAVLLASVGIVGAFLLSRPFALLLVTYAVLTFAYSVRLKAIPLLDVATIAALFSLRIVMGSILVGAPSSSWLLYFSIFFFFSLALAKRHVELIKIRGARNQQVKGRGYRASDWPLTLTFGIGAALCSIIVMLLYMTNEVVASQLYEHPDALLIIPPVILLWTLRIWFLSHRGLLDDDPVIFALRDWISWGLGVVVAIGFLFAL